MPTSDAAEFGPLLMIESCADALAKVDDKKDAAVIRIAEDFVEAIRSKLVCNQSLHRQFRIKLFSRIVFRRVFRQAISACGASLVAIAHARF